VAVISNTMDVQFCVDALEEAPNRYGHPDIFNTARGRQFTSWAWPHCLKQTNEATGQKTRTVA